MKKLRTNMIHSSYCPISNPLDSAFHCRKKVQCQVTTYNSRNTRFSPSPPLMASTAFVSVLFFLAFSMATAQRRPPNINTGSSLSPTTNPTSWLSPSGHFAFGFYRQGDGFAVGVWLVGDRNDPNIVVWTANRDNPPVPRNTTLLLSPDGGLVLRSGDGKSNPIATGSDSVSFASMLDTGNFVMYNSDSMIIWQTFDSPTNTILIGQRLLSRKELVSSVSLTNHSSGRFKIRMQNDGNLVFYPTKVGNLPKDSYWSTGTFNGGQNVTLHLDNNGRLFLLNSTGFNIRNLTNALNPRIDSTSTSIFRATLDYDGILRLYSHLFNQNSTQTISVRWKEPSNKCDVKGLCGLNSFCTLNDIDAVCNCPRNFDFVDPGQKSLGCERNFIAERCRRKTENMTYDIFRMDDIEWDDDPYEVLRSISDEDCREACLQDCECEAALHKDGDCRKQKLPLRYGRRNLGGSKAFIKFGSGNLTSSGGSSRPSLISRVEKKFPMEIVILIVVLFTCSVLFFAASSILIYRHRRKRRSKLISHAQNSSSICNDFAPRAFTYDELQEATDGFKEVLGKGAFGTVYRGIILDGRLTVAVKRLDVVVEEGDREFRTEIRAIGRTHHRNLVHLLGFCDDGPHKLLMYEYMCNGSLAGLLFNPEKCLNWNQKVKIAMDIARGILYLHEECQTPIIHCDIKPQNILMDESNVAKISDFGLAKLMKPDQTKTFTGIRGTRGYVAPEWHKNMAITVKADVYSFGIVLLEIVCCRRSIELEAEEEKVVLSDWVYDCFLANELEKVVASDEVDRKMLERMVMVGLWCIQDDPFLRPSMKKVVLMLEGTVVIPIPPSPTSFLSSI